MEIKTKLNVTVQELDDCIREMVAQDVQLSTGKKVKPEDISRGYKYNKNLKNKFGKANTIVTKIRELSTGKYFVVFESAHGVNSLKYEYVSNEDGYVDLNYEEDFEGKTNMKGLNHKMMMFLYKRSSKKKANLTISKIENYIIAKRS